MVNGQAGKGDRYRPVPPDYGDRYSRIKWKPTAWERVKVIIKRCAIVIKRRMK